MAQQVERDAPPARALLQAGGIALLLVALGLLVRQAGGGALHAVRPTVGGAAILVVAGGLLTASGLPRQFVAFAGGYAFGAWEGGLLSLLGQMLGCGLAFAAARTVAGDWARRRLARSGRLHRMLAAHPFGTTLTLRLVPVGNNLILNLLAGVAGIRAVPFLAATAIGYVPQTVIFALLGSGAQLGRGAQLGIAAVLFAAAAAGGLVLYRRAGEESRLNR